MKSRDERLGPPRARSIGLSRTSRPSGLQSGCSSRAPAWADTLRGVPFVKRLVGRAQVREAQSLALLCALFGVALGITGGVIEPVGAIGLAAAPAIEEFPPVLPEPAGLTTGADGNVWFTDYNGNGIG